MYLKTNSKIIFFSSLLLYVAVLSSCNTEENEINEQFLIENPKTLEFGSFSIDVPQNWNGFVQQGIDTYVGGFTNKTDTLYFDFGYFSFGSIDNIQENAETISFEVLKIDGEDAKIVIEKREQEPEIRYSLYVDKRDQTNLNRIYTYGFDDEDLIKAIFLSHKFKN